MRESMIAAVAAASALAAPAAEAASTAPTPGAPAPAIRDAVAPKPSAATDGVIRDAVLGFCFRRVFGTPLIPSTLDTGAADWRPLLGYEATNGLRLFAPRSNPAGVIVDVAPADTSCWVQGVGTAGLADRIHEDLVAGGAQVLDDKSDAGVRTMVYGILTAGSATTPIVVLHRYAEPAGLVSAVVVKGEQKPRA